MSKIEELGNALVALNVAEVKELADYLKEKYGLEANVPVAAVVVAPEPEVVVEQTSFDVMLNNKLEGADKLGCVKILNRIINIGLQPTKALIESAPVMILTGVSKAEAENLKNQLVALNADITIK